MVFQVAPVQCKYCKYQGLVYPGEIYFIHKIELFFYVVTRKLRYQGRFRIHKLALEANKQEIRTIAKKMLNVLYLRFHSGRQ